MKLQLTPEAIADIDEIKKYIRDDLDNPAAANRIVAKIRKSYKRLKTSPYVGKKLDVDSQYNYRFLICDNHLIFYIVDENLVSVHRIIHGKRDYFKFLFGESFDDNMD